MARVFILEEQDGHDVEFKGEAPRNYLVSEMGADDYVEGNRKLLYDFLRVQERFPLYLSFTVYEGMYEELHAMFCANHIEHTVETSEVKNNYSSYYPHCFRVVVKEVIEPATFFIIEGDAQGFFLFSNEDGYATVDRLVKRLPREATVCQINDTMFEAF